MVRLVSTPASRKRLQAVLWFRAEVSLQGFQYSLGFMCFKQYVNHRESTCKALEAPLSDVAGHKSGAMCIQRLWCRILGLDFARHFEEF